MSSKLPDQVIARFPVTLTAAQLAEAAGDELPDPIPFDPVPRLRRRRNGWTEERQRAFIAVLQLCGSISAAARAVGMSPRSAYRLAEADGADSFARAWDAAFAEGIARMRADALDRSIHGSLVPVYRGGRLVRVEHRRNDRLAIALLGGRDRAVDEGRRSAVARRRSWRDMHALDAKRAEEKRQREEAAKAYAEELEAMLEKAERMRRQPRVVGL
jgi:transposase-like protein